MPYEYDILIIGAGAAGLMACCELHDSDKSVALSCGGNAGFHMK